MLGRRPIAAHRDSLISRYAETLGELTLRRQTERLGPRAALRFKRFGVWSDLSWDARFECVHASAAAFATVVSGSFIKIRQRMVVQETGSTKMASVFHRNTLVWLSGLMNVAFAVLPELPLVRPNH